MGGCCRLARCRQRCGDAEVGAKETEVGKKPAIGDTSARALAGATMLAACLGEVALESGSRCLLLLAHSRTRWLLLKAQARPWWSWRPANRVRRRLGTLRRRRTTGALRARSSGRESWFPRPRDRGWGAGTGARLAALLGGCWVLGAGSWELFPVTCCDGRIWGRLAATVQSSSTAMH